jgi:hypothetical protein
MNNENVLCFFRYKNHPVVITEISRSFYESLRRWIIKGVATELTEIQIIKPKQAS